MRNNAGIIATSFTRSVVAGSKFAIQVHGRRGQRDPRKFGRARPSDHGSS